MTSLKLPRSSFNLKFKNKNLSLSQTRSKRIPRLKRPKTRNKINLHTRSNYSY